MDEKAKRKKSGKRAVIGDNIAICTVEIRDGFGCGRIVAPVEKRKCDKNCKSKARTSEKVPEDEELAEDSSESDYSDCIIVVVRNSNLNAKFSVVDLSLRNVSRYATTYVTELVRFMQQKLVHTLALD